MPDAAVDAPTRKSGIQMFESHTSQRRPIQILGNKSRISYFLSREGSDQTLAPEHRACC
jgi:hypothetical protein